ETDFDMFRYLPNSLRANLLTIDKRKRKVWNEFYASSDHPEDVVKDHLINKIHKIYPGFKYLIDFKWEDEGYTDKGRGNLIFGSDYGIHLIIETMALHTGNEGAAQDKVKIQATRYREYAAKNFGSESKVIGATCIFTNIDFQIHFLEDNENIAKLDARGERFNLFERKMVYKVSYLKNSLF